MRREESFGILSVVARVHVLIPTLATWGLHSLRHYPDKPFSFSCVQVMKTLQSLAEHEHHAHPHSADVHSSRNKPHIGQFAHIPKHSHLPARHSTHHR